MLNKSRLLTVVLVAGVLLPTTLLLVSPAQGQRLKRPPVVQDKLPQPPSSDINPATQYSAIKPNENDDYQRLIEVARDYTLGKSWKEAVRALQKILDSKEAPSALLKHIDPITGEERVRRASVRFEANNLLGSMPREGLDAYEVAFGVAARDLLNEAKRKGDRELLADVAMRFMHTRAGIEANDLRATAALDRGEFHDAALRFRQLLERPDARAKVTDLTLFKAALAYRRAGDTDGAEKICEILSPRLQAAGGLRVADETYAAARLKGVLDRIPPAPRPNPHDWPLVGGDPTRSAQAKGSPPLLDEILWMRKTILDKNDESGEVDRGAEAKAWLDQAIQQARDRGMPILPGCFPIAANGRLIYRTYNGITAVNIKEVIENGKVVAKPGEVDWKSTEFVGALAPLLANPNLRGTADVWLRQVYNPYGFINLVYENSAVGTLSTDNRLVYTIDDLAVPAPPSYLAPHVWNSPQVADKIKPLVMGNSLQAFELESGKIAFQLGKLDANDEFSNSHFLGAPLPLSGRLYMLNEKNDGQLRLYCIEPRLERRPEGARWGYVIIPPTQVLGTVLEHHRVTEDISRRANTVHLAYGEGVLVCPTNAGEILGVDLQSRTLAWSYPYRQTPPHPQSMLTNPQFQFQPPTRPMALTYSNWKVSPPVIVDGKVVFTAPDSVSVHCINLRDGTPVWTVRQMENDLFLAGVFDGKVLVVGKNSCRAYRLSDGVHAWTVGWNNDMPSGQGVASKNVYYLPLHKNEILAIDVARGVVKAHNRASKAGSPPGNLVFYEGAVLSQNVEEVVAYPQLSAKVELAFAAVKADPNNLDKLASRGELLLRDGQVPQAVADLRAVWKKNPPAPLQNRVRQSLYDAMTDLLRIDFKGVREKYLSEYEELCKVPGKPEEQEQRQAKFLQILGDGLETEGNLVDAFQAYRKFGSLPLFRDKGIPSREDPGQTVPSTVWLRGRVMTMLGKATPAQRVPLEAKIGAEWKAVEAKGNLDSIRSFVGMFDVPFQVGREARLKLADTIIEKKDTPAYLEAELNLQQLRVPGLKEDPKVGGRALDALARLEVSKGKAESMRLAMAYYKELSQEFPKVVLRNNKTGTQLYGDLFNDKRFLAYVNESEMLWGKAKFKGREVAPGEIAPGLQGFVFQPVGDTTPFMRQHRLVLDPVNSNSPMLRVLDVSTNQVRGEPINLGNVPANYMYFRHLYDQAERNLAYHPNARFRFYQCKGHLAVFQVGTVAYGLDMANVKLLWQFNLLDLPQNQPQPPGIQVMPDNDGNLWLTQTQFGQQTTKRQVGRVGAVEASYVALTTSKGLVVLDPLRGVPLWTKINVSPGTEIFGDDQHIYLVNTSGSTISGPSQVLRASDGTLVAVRDFTHLYKHRLRVQGRNLLAADPAGGKLTLRLYDVLAEKDVWKQAFDPKAVVLQTESDHLAGVIEPNGKVVVVDLRTFKEVLNASVVEARVTQDDVKNLQKPLLLEDSERFYVALNQPIDANKVMGGVLANNFSNGLRCAPVNGWFCAFLKKTGAFDWHLESKTTNQMIVLEQFRNLPVLLFSVRYTEPIRGGIGGARMVSYTGSVDKETGSVIWWPPEPRLSNGAAQFYAFNIDVKAGTINMIGYNGTVQHYIDDGRKRQANNGGVAPGAGPGLVQPPAIRPPGLAPLPGKLPPNGIRGRLRGVNLQPVQPPVVQPEPVRKGALRLPVREAEVPKR